MRRMVFAFAALWLSISVGIAEAGLLRGPEVWLEFMGGNVRKDGLRCDLEAIKGAGVSGVHFFHISRGEAWPECPEQIPCMSEKWGEVVQFLGDECARLDLALTVQNCPGWSQSGGPWIDLDHCMRDIECARLDFDGGALRTTRPTGVETNGDERIYTFSEPITIRSMALPGLNDWNPDYVYHAPWLRVSLEAKTADGWRDAVRTLLPVSSWRDYVYALTLACHERTANVWRYRIEHDYPVVKWGEPQFFTAARHTDWEAKSARVLRSLLNERPPVQDSRSWVDGSKIVDLTGADAQERARRRFSIQCRCNARRGRTAMC